MLTLLHLLSAVALLVWGTHIVRTGVMRVYGARLRTVLSSSVEKKPLAFCAGLGVTALVQSSNATTMLVTSFVAQDLVGLMPALVMVLGADVGTALMARVLTFDLSWLSPLLIFIGVIFFLGRKQTRAGQLGRVGIGLGLILLALELIVQAVHPITQANGVQVIFASLTGDIMLDALIGAVFAIISYSSLAAVLLTATLTAAGAISFPVALANAARETLRIGDAMEQMLESLHKVMHGEPRQEKELRRMADDINVLYTAIKLYLARMPKDELAEEESRRWAEIIEMSLNLEQASDIVERMGSEIADKSLAARRAFSVEGLKELDALYDLLLSNLQLAMSVFFSSDVPSARRLRRSKHRFRILNRRYSHAHVDRLHQQNVQSIETSTLHLALLGDMKRLNSLFCSVAYSVMEQPDEDDERDDY
ncbi:TPA: Na/Pi cotransporter family protein [Klebsiella pneumoniae]|uniref:Na/Pi cotransporter family protein n=1 Tax=Klebsiella pneumoniae TaxID=573 RepID=UPI002175CD28|nr:Na/Pi cotransporter family protein [Klebsiella pneumoniae]UVZ75703.1 Na/Pi cotransporter family protein [Klebsiella pneumoniae]UWB24289.1 Na/Pi cotransporter family protein [Klebsiella pneumoniae]HCJ5071047.1 Na/Pi cotransporter family protein [Klebsiella pneumoniae]HCK0115108.1 Na/Pi cotransporter family protein [Klebsiella pneumoniae]HCK0120562.1 Na/Pi cotransporter family protein [Klebsiella pneumoniae]